MQAVILAGGLGTRLGELGKYKPKSMILVCGQPFLKIQLDNLKAQGYTDILLCVGHLWEQIQEHFGDGRNFGANLLYSVENKPLGTAGALKNAEPLLQDNFFTIYGDSYLTLDIPQIERYFLSMKNLGLMTVIKNFGKWDKSNTVVQDGYVSMYSKVEESKDMIFCDYGLNFFNKNVLEMIPDQQFVGLEEVFQKLIEKKQLLAYQVNERFYEIGSINGLIDLERYLQKDQK